MQRRNAPEYREELDGLRPQYKVKGRRRGKLPPHAVRAINAAKPGEPSFVCEICGERFRLAHLKVDRGSLTRGERNLCRDCYKELGL
jgi:hypothetical protein